MSIKDAYDDPDTYDFNEDFYRQIELLPKENFKAISKTADEIAELSEKTFDGNGWWDCYVRSEVDFPTKNRKIPAEEISTFFLHRGYFEFKRVTESQSVTATVQHNTKAFKNKSIIVCFNYKDDIVENIWLNTSPNDGDSNEYKEILILLSTKYGFVLADWWKSIIVDTSDSSKIDAYFKVE